MPNAHKMLASANIVWFFWAVVKTFLRSAESLITLALLKLRSISHGLLSKGVHVDYERHIGPPGDSLRTQAHLRRGLGDGRGRVSLWGSRKTR